MGSRAGSSDSHQEMGWCTGPGIGRIKPVANRFGTFKDMRSAGNCQDFTRNSGWNRHQNGSRQAAGIAAVIIHFAIVFLDIVADAKIGESAVRQLIGGNF